MAQSERLAALTEDERAEHGRVQVELAGANERILAATRTQGLASAWADLGLAIFNLKEFIFVR